jgi:hypothetical protein
MFFKIRCIGFTSWRSKFLGFTRSTLASHICSTDSIPWVHHSREEGSLDYDGRLVHLQVYLRFDMIIHRQQAPFSGAVVGEQVIKIWSFIAFCVIDFHRLEINRKNARSGSYAPRTSSTYQSWTLQRSKGRSRSRHQQSAWCNIHPSLVNKIWTFTSKRSFNYVRHSTWTGLLKIK